MKTNLLDYNTVVRSRSKQTNEYYYFLDGIYYDHSLVKVFDQENVIGLFNWLNAEHFTKSFDKNNKPIFDGDIVMVDVSRYDSRIKNRRIVKTTVEFIDSHKKYGFHNIQTEIHESERIEIVI